MPQGFIDHAFVSSALAALTVQDARRVSAWDRQCLTESTYLLLFHEIGIVPGPGDYRGASGTFSHVISSLPSLASERFSTAQPLRSTKAWLSRQRTTIRGIWREAERQPDFPIWSALMRDLFWIDHVRMFGSLFDLQFLPHLANVMECSSQELQEVQQRTRDEAAVHRWLKTNLSSDEARLASDAYFLSMLIRGKFHEYVATSSGLHLCGHPFRKVVQKPLRTASSEPVSNAEQYFVKVIVGSALLETSKDRRVRAWLENIGRARRAIELGRIALPSALIDSDAERLAAEAAKTTGISATYGRVRRELEAAAGLGIGYLASIAINPWLILVAPFIPHTYKHLRGVSIGEDLSRTFLDTKRRFRRLARRTAGRIERTVLPP